MKSGNTGIARQTVQQGNTEKPSRGGPPVHSAPLVHLRQVSEQRNSRPYEYMIREENAETAYKVPRSAAVAFVYSTYTSYDFRPSPQGYFVRVQHKAAYPHSPNHPVLKSHHPD